MIETRDWIKENNSVKFEGLNNSTGEKENFDTKIESLNHNNSFASIKHPERGLITVPTYLLKKLN